MTEAEIARLPEVTLLVMQAICSESDLCMCGGKKKCHLETLDDAEDANVAFGIQAKAVIKALDKAGYGIIPR